MKNFFISPHFDDAIGACGGYMQSLTNVVVCTVFAGNYDMPLSELAVKLHKEWQLSDAVNQRCEENSRACKYLNVSYVNLPFQEAIYRKSNGDPLYTRFKELKDVSAVLDSILIKEIKKEFLIHISIEDSLYFPMAFGYHIDHRIVHQVGIELVQAGYNVYFYSDFYYPQSEPSTEYGKKTITFSHDKLTNKINACMFYHSQIDNLFGSKEAFEKYMYEQKNANDDFCEFYYYKKSSKQK